MQSVLAVQADVSAFEVGELGATERAGKSDEQQCGVAAFEEVVGPPVASGAGGVVELPDVGTRSGAR